MPLVTVSSPTVTAGVIGGSITRTLSGVPIADLVIDRPDGTGFTAGTKVTVQSENGYSLTMTVDPNRTGDFLDAVHVRLRGGAAGMNKTASNRGYMQPGAFVRDVINGLMADSGETLSSTTDAGFLATNLNSWMVAAKPVSWNLNALIKWVSPTMNWRILADGTTWIGNESWPSASGTFDILRQDPKQGLYEIGVESPFIVPGTNLSGVGNVNRVVDIISGGRLRSTVSVDLPGEGDRSFEGGIQRLVGQYTAGVDFYGTYFCQVVTQSQDLTTVDIQPLGDVNKQRIGGLQRVPVRFGAGHKIQLLQGATVLLGWDGGNPQNPYAFAPLSSDKALGWSFTNTTNDGVAVAPASVKTNVGGATWINAQPASLTLGTNPAATPALSVGAVDSMGVPVTNSPTNTGTVLVG